MAAWGQAGAPAPADSSAKSPVYEVVSIKPATTGGNSGWWKNLPDGFQFRNMALRSLIYSAYDIIMENQVSGLPGWAKSDPYDIDAKVDTQTAEAWKNLSDKEREKQEQSMLRALLADRCQFRGHEVTRELPVYDVVIAKGGLKMKEAPANEKTYYTTMGGRDSKVSAHATSVEMIMNSLSWSVGRLIVDKTGLGDKKFDFELQWTPDDQRAADNTVDAGPSLFTALEEQLGLKLVSSKGPVDVLVIDHIEKPSVN
jgi:uncharacterized protein (TIGR03435 family)